MEECLLSLNMIEFMNGTTEVDEPRSRLTVTELLIVIIYLPYIIIQAASV